MQRIKIPLLILIIVTLLIILLKGKRENDILQTTNTVLLEKSNNFKLKHNYDWCFDEVTAKIISKSDNIILSDTFQAEIFLAGFNAAPEYQNEAILLLGEDMDEKYNLLGEIDTLPVNNWKGEIKMIPDKVGEHELFLHFLIPNDEDYDVFPIRTKFKVNPKEY